MTERDNEYEIDLVWLFQELLKYAWFILIITLMVGITGLLLASQIIPAKYQASTTMYVNNNTSSGGDTITSADLSASKSLVGTYSVILKSYVTLSEVIEETGVDYSYEQLKDMIETTSVDNTEVLRVTVTSTDPQEAANIANAIAHVAPKTITNVVKGSSVSLLDEARVPTSKSEPSITKYTALGLVLGMVISAGIVVVKALLDDKIHGEQYLLDNYKFPLLAAIPDIAVAEKLTGNT